MKVFKGIMAVGSFLSGSCERQVRTAGKGTVYVSGWSRVGTSLSLLYDVIRFTQSCFAYVHAISLFTCQILNRAIDCKPVKLTLF